MFSIQSTIDCNIAAYILMGDSNSRQGNHEVNDGRWYTIEGEQRILMKYALMGKNNDTDILLIAPPLIWGQENRMDLKPPVNLIYLYSYLKGKGIRVRMLDVLSESLGIEDLLETVKAMNPRLIGLPFYQASLRTTFELIRRLKEENPGTKITGGGPSITIEYDRILSNSGLDLAVIGEGEATLENIVLSENESDYAKIDGLAYLSGGMLMTNSPRQHIDDLDTLPFLDYSPVRMNVYFDYQRRLKTPPSIFVTTSRGCPFRCTFCATPLLWPGKLRRYSPLRVVEEIRYQITRYPGISIGFLDDSFFSDRKWLDEFFDLIAPLKIKYHCIGRIDQLNRDIIKNLVDTGCDFIAFGVETGSNERQKKIKKFLDLDKLEKNVRILSEFNIVTKGFFMLGFPDETPQDMADTINMAAHLKRIGMRRFSIFPLIVYPGTEIAIKNKISNFDSSIYEKCLEDIDDMDDFGEKSIAMYSTIPEMDINPYFSHKEIIRLVKLAYNRIEKNQGVTTEEIKSYQTSKRSDA